MNGFNIGRFHTIGHWWFALLSRGVRWTGTAVSDTHSWNSSISGGARTFVYVGAGKDTPETFDVGLFAKQINAMRVTGSSGPFVVVTASAGDKSATVGDTLAVAPGGDVMLKIDIQGADWLSLEAIDIYRSPTDTAPPPGETSTASLKPFATVALKDGTLGEPTAKVTADGYYVVTVRGKKNSIPAPLVNGKDVTPFAFTNPIFVDADGNGYDNPPAGKFGTTTPPPRKPGPPAWAWISASCSRSCANLKSTIIRSLSNFRPIGS